MIATSRSLGMSLLERIGNTPLISLERLTAHLPGVQILGKVEWANPGGSIKDRAAAAYCARCGEARPAEVSSAGQRGRALMDATSGNTGIAYAMLGAALGFPVTLCVPSNVSPERKNILAAYGANVIWTDPADGSDGAIRKARELMAAEPERYFYADQYGNDQNWMAHYRDDGERDLAADRGAGDALRRRAGHQRNLHGDDAAAAGVEPGDPVHLHAAGLAVQRLRGAEAHGDGDRAADLRRRAGG